MRAGHGPGRCVVGRGRAGGWDGGRQVAQDDVPLGGEDLPARAQVLQHRGVVPGEARDAPGRAEGRHRYSWIPFGGGAHACIGSAFALMEMKIAIATITRRYRMTLLRPTRPADMLVPRPIDGLHMRLEPRR